MGGASTGNCVISVPGVPTTTTSTAGIGAMTQQSLGLHQALGGGGGATLLQTTGGNRNVNMRHRKH